LKWKAIHHHHHHHHHIKSGENSRSHSTADSPSKVSTESGGERMLSDNDSQYIEEMSDNTDTDNENEMHENEYDPFPEWGVPFPLLVDRVTVRQIHAYAADFLQADGEKVTDATKKKKIVVSILEMSDKEMRNTSKKSLNTGLYLGELTFLLIWKIVGHLLRKSKGKLAILAGSAAAHALGSGLSSTAKTATSTLRETYYNMNIRNMISSFGGSKTDYDNHGIAIAPEVQTLGIHEVYVHVRSLQKAVRHGNISKKIKTASIELTLMNEAGNIIQESQTRMANQHGIVVYDEKFSLGPVQDFSSILRIKVMRRVVTGEKTCFCYVDIDLRDRRKVFVREEKSIIVPCIPGCPDNGLHNTNKLNCDGELHLVLKLY